MAWGSGVLENGSSGSDVSQLQKFLNDHGAHLTVDGQFGPITEAAVKAYQKSQGISPDGVVGPITWGKIAGASGSKTAASSTSKSDDLAKKIVAQFPGLAPFLGVPELKNLLTQAATENWTTDRFLAAVRGTSWWKTHTSTQQDWTTLSPAEQESRIRDTAAKMYQYELSNGGQKYIQAVGRGTLQDVLRLDRGTAAAIASGSKTFEEWASDAMNAMLKNPNSDAHFQQQETQRQEALAKQRPEELANQFFTDARQKYWVPMTNADALKWGKLVDAGTNSQADFYDYLRTTAEHLYSHIPGFQQQIANGSEPGTLFAPYLNVASKELETSPSALVMDNRVFGDFISGTVQNGQLPSMADFIKKVRALPEWQQTMGANQLASDGALQILNTFGKTKIA